MKRVFLLFCVALILILSCQSADQRLAPKALEDIRIEDIRTNITINPEKALFLIGAFRTRYLKGDEQGLRASELSDLEQRAIHALREVFLQAVSSGDYVRALSLRRSLSLFEVPEISEVSIYLNLAQDFLEKDADLSAFLALYSAQMLQAQDDAILEPFYKRAVQLGEFTTAAWIASCMSAEKSSQDTTQRPHIVEASVAQMLKGVATVWVDRGVKRQNGVSVLDRGIGSAFFVSSNGYLITNYHVIQSEVDPEYNSFSRLYIRMGDSSSLRIPAKVIGWDIDLDLALIQAEITPEYVFSMMDLAHPVVGDTIRVIGSPAGLEKTVSSGIVSAVSRRFLTLGDVFQIDAAVNQGNSGGPVIDSQGRLAGLAFAGLEQFQGLNFALSAERLRAVLPQLLAGGKNDHAWIGLAVHADYDGLKLLYTLPQTPVRELLPSPDGTFKSFCSIAPDNDANTAIIRYQDELLRRRPGELIELSLENGTQYILRCDIRPEKPLVQALKMESKERLTAVLYGFSVKSAGSLAFEQRYSVDKVYHGTIAEEAGLSINDPIIFRNFVIFEDDDFAVLEIAVKKRKMGFLESWVSLPASLQSSDIL